MSVCFGDNDNDHIVDDIINDTMPLSFLESVNWLGNIPNRMKNGYGPNIYLVPETAFSVISILWAH